MDERYPKLGRNAVPEEIPFEDTGKLGASIYSAVSSESESFKPEQFIETLAQKLSTRSGPEVHAKAIRRHNWIAAIMALVLGPGGALAVIYATSDRSKENSKDVVHLKEKLDKSLVPRIERTEQAIDSVLSTMGEVQADQAAIASGIQELKSENVNRLKEELIELRRELRRKK